MSLRIASLTEDDRLAVRLSEAARLLDISEGTVKKLILTGELTSFRVGPKVRLIPMASLRGFISKRSA